MRWLHNRSPFTIYRLLFFARLYALCDLTWANGKDVLKQNERERAHCPLPLLLAATETILTGAERFSSAPKLWDEA
jgi:hypothetical protein